MERRSFFSFRLSGITVTYSVWVAVQVQMPTSHTTWGRRFSKPIIWFSFSGEKTILLLFGQPILEHVLYKPAHLHPLFVQLGPNSIPQFDGQINRCLGVTFVAVLSRFAPRLLRPRCLGLFLASPRRDAMRLSLPCGHYGVLRIQHQL